MSFNTYRGAPQGCPILFNIIVSNFLTGPAAPVLGSPTQKQKKMRKEEPLPPRYAVVKQLQEKLAKLEPGTDEYDLIDKAYELALNPKRKYNEYFMYNLLREARRILKRKPNMQFVSIDGAKPYPVESLVLDRAISYNRAGDEIDYKTLINSVTFICEKTHSRAIDVLLCMLDDCDINTTAGRTNMSLSLAKKVTSKIKKQVNLKFNN